MSESHPLQFLDQRRSIPSKQLGEPGPDAATLRRMLAAASRVPDHGKLVPFRFLHIHGSARQRLGDALAELTLRRDPAAPAAAVDKDRARFSHAPDVITVIARLTPGHKVPEQEQLLTAGSVCFALLQAAQALGFGAQWLTAWMAYDPDVAKLLGLAANERVVGFIHVGTAKLDAPERERPDVDALLSEWQAEA